MSDDARRQRAAARRSWAAQVLRPGDAQPDDDLSLTTTAAQRLGMMWELVEQTWALSQRPIPTYERASMPARVLRPDRR